MDLCRLCYSCTYPELRQNIFNEKFDPPIWKIIADISKLEITKDDPYTKIVCVHCFVQLKNFYTFREMMLNTDYRIRHCSMDKKDSIETVLEETTLSSDLQNDHDKEPIICDNKSDNNQNSIRIELNDELSIEETQQSHENQIDLSSPTIKMNVDEILNEGIEEQPPKIARNDKIENNSDTKASNVQKLKNDSNTNEIETNTDKKLSQINVKDIEGIVDCSSTDKIVLEQPFNKHCENINESIDGNSTITGEELYECGVCHETFPQEHILETHIKSVHSDQKFYKCEICKKNFLTVHQLPLHSKEHAKDDDNLKVCIYENLFNNAKKFIYMDCLQTYFEKKSLQCDTCGKNFLSNNALDFHLRIHTKPYQCDTCGKKFSCNDYLQIHLIRHTDEQPHRCKYCSRTFTYDENLQTHLKVHSDEKPHLCDICGKEFACYQKLKVHLKVHSEKQHLCDICGEKFRDTSTLKRHNVVHTGLKSHQCNVCGKKFSFTTDLRKHSAVHTDERSFSCNICDKRFTLKSNLKKHLRIHTGEKPYECHICNRRFLHKNRFRTHFKVHSGDKSFDCKTCSLSFSRRYDLSTHLKQEHKNK